MLCLIEQGFLPLLFLYFVFGGEGQGFKDDPFSFYSLFSSGNVMLSAKSHV